MRISDTDARRYRNQEPAKVLSKQEKEKKDKYLRIPLPRAEEGLHPLVYSVDGLAGREAWSVERRLAAQLASKWGAAYSRMVHYIRARMALALARANSLLLRGSRDRQRPRPPLIDGRASLYDWHHGLD